MLNATQIDAIDSIRPRLEAIASQVQAINALAASACLAMPPLFVPQAGMYWSELDRQLFHHECAMNRAGVPVPA